MEKSDTALLGVMLAVILLICGTIYLKQEVQITQTKSEIAILSEELTQKEAQQASAHERLSAAQKEYEQEIILNGKWQNWTMQLKDELGK